MLNPEQIRTLVHNYIQMMCRSDIDGIITLFADDATAEDPVGGGDVQKGKSAIRDFFAQNAPALQIKLTGPICVAGNECAFPIFAELTLGDAKSYLDATDVFCFDEDGKISSMRAFWSLAELRPQP